MKWITTAKLVATLLIFFIFGLAMRSHWSRQEVAYREGRYAIWLAKLNDLKFQKIHYAKAVMDSVVPGHLDEEVELHGLSTEEKVQFDELVRLILRYDSDRAAEAKD